jgi:hypothetical protein
LRLICRNDGLHHAWMNACVVVASKTFEGHGEWD